MKKIISDEIDINIETLFVPERSIIERNRFFFMYTVSIKNFSQQTVQLIRTCGPHAGGGE